MRDLNRFAHVEDEDLIARRHRGGLHDQTARLGDRHKEARNVRMRDSHRTALGDLVPEAGNDRTVRAQHIPEARGDETRLPRRAALLDRQTQRLHIDLRKALRATHHVRRVHGLVRRDHNHLLNIVFDALVSDVARSRDVYQNRLAWVLLHQRDVFVSRSVEHHLRMVRPEHEVQTGGNPDVADDRDEFQGRIALLQFQAKVVHRGLPVVEKDKLLHPERRQLTAKLRADGTCRPRNQDRPPAEVGDDLIHRNADLGTA